MSGDRMPVAALTQKLGDSDFHRAVVAMMPGGTDVERAGRTPLRHRALATALRARADGTVTVDDYREDATFPLIPRRETHKTSSH